MPRLPAACTECGALYPSPLRARGLDADTAFEVPVPCPACGSGGRVPAEVLRRLTGLVGTLEATAPDEERLETFLEELEEVFREADEREDAVLDALRVDPGLGRLVGGLPGGTPALMAAFLPLVRRLSASLRRGSQEPPSVLVERVLEELHQERVAEEEGPEEPEEVVRAHARLDAAGRNAPCPCGSGEKYKDCHWVEDVRMTRGDEGG